MNIVTFRVVKSCEFMIMRNVTRYNKISDNANDRQSGDLNYWFGIAAVSLQDFANRANEEKYRENIDAQRERTHKSP